MIKHGLLIQSMASWAHTRRRMQNGWWESARGYCPIVHSGGHQPGAYSIADGKLWIQPWQIISQTISYSFYSPSPLTQPAYSFTLLIKKAFAELKTLALINRNNSQTQQPLHFPFFQVLQHFRVLFGFRPHFCHFSLWSEGQYSFEADVWSLC